MHYNKTITGAVSHCEVLDSPTAVETVPVLQETDRGIKNSSNDIPPHSTRRGPTQNSDGSQASSVKPDPKLYRSEAHPIII